MTQLRPYQQSAVDSIAAEYKRGRKSTLLTLATGGGKTVIFSHIAERAAAKGNRTCVLVHRRELLDQASRSLSAMSVDHSTIAAGNPVDMGAMIHVASVQTLARRLAALPPDYFKLIIVDECFPPGTLVDGKPIEMILPGDTVSAADDSTGAIYKARVKRVIRGRAPSLMARITFSGGAAFCTTLSHPIHTIEHGYIPAGIIAVGDRVSTMPLVSRPSGIIHRVSAGSIQFHGKGLLQQAVLNGISRTSKQCNDGSHKSQARIKSHERAKSDVVARSEEKDEGHIAAHWPSPISPRRQRTRPNATPAIASASAGVANGSDSKHQNAQGVGIPISLQTGHWMSRSFDRHRSRRRIALRCFKAGARQKKRGVLGVARVESIEIYKQRSDKQSGSSFVYNLEVEKYHNYFASGILVHNCHHTNAGTWASVIKHFDQARLLGVTASPIRADGRGLGEHYESMVLGPDAGWLTANGFLAPAKYYAPPPAINTAGLKALAGDCRMDQAASELDKPAVMGDVIGHYRRLMDGGTAIAFCCSIVHAEDTAAAFVSAGIAAASIDGGMSAETRRQLLADLGAGQIKVLTSCALIGEGVDVPSVNGCIMLRPTMSVGLHLQMIGRCLRPSEGKTHAVIIDHVGNALEHGFHTDHRDWSLDGKSKRPRDAISIRICKKCYAANPSTVTHCQECGAEFEVKSVDDIVTIAGELTALAPKGMRPGDPVYADGESGLFYVASNPEDGQVLLCRSRAGAIAIHRGTMRREQLDSSIVAALDSLHPHIGPPKRASSGAQTLEQLQQIEKQKGYKPGWSLHVWRSRMAKVGR